MQLIGVTGGIASGKSTIAKRLEELGAHLIDADQLARDVVEPGEPTLQEIAREFGPGILLADGALDRPQLGRLVFGDEERLEALNEIVHPAVQLAAEKRIAEIIEQDPDAIIVYDIPLLVEAGQNYPWDLIVVADAPAPVREERLVKLRGMALEDARARIASQATDDARRSVADVVIDTAGTLERTLTQVDDLWRMIEGFLTTREGSSEA